MNEIQSIISKLQHQYSLLQKAESIGASKRVLANLNNIKATSHKLINQINSITL